MSDNIKEYSFPVKGIFTNNKNKQSYKQLSSNVIDVTNLRNNTISCLYISPDNKLFVREASEFFQKFSMCLCSVEGDDCIEDTVEIINFPVKNIFRNIKSSKIYNLLSSSVIDATNDRKSINVCLYVSVNDNKLYVREASEFFSKYELLINKE